MSDYVLRYLPIHLIRSRRWDELCELLSNFDFLELKSKHLSVHTLLADLITAADALPEGSVKRPLLQEIYSLFDLNAHTLQGLWPEPLTAFLTQQIRNSAFEAGDQVTCARAEARLITQTDIWLKQLGRLPVRPIPTHRVLAGHRNVVFGLAFSPNGSFLATSDYDGVIYLWEAQTGRVVRKWQGHTRPVEDIAFSPNGRVLASAGWDNTVRLWDVENGGELQCLKGHTALVRSVAFSPDGSLIASGSADCSVRLWSASNGASLLTSIEHGDDVRCVVFSHDGRWLASCGYEHQILLWETATGRVVKRLEGHSSIVWHLAFHPSDKFLASASTDHTMRIWDVTSAREVHRLEGFRASVSCVAFSPDGHLLATSAHDGWESMLRLWDTRTFREVTQLDGHTTVVWRTVFSPDGKLLASCSSDRTARLWLVEPVSHLDSDTVKHTRRVVSIGLSGGHRMITSSVDSAVWVWDTLSGNIAQRLPVHPVGTVEVALSDDGQIAATATEDGTIQLWNVASGQERSNLHCPSGHAMRITFSGDGQFLAAIGEGQVYVWTVADSQLISSIVLSNGHLSSLTFNANGHFLAVGTNMGQVAVWDWRSNQERLKLNVGLEADLRALAFSSDDRMVAAGSEDRIVRVWKLDDGSIWPLEGHTHWVRALAFSPDGFWLASGGWDRTIRLWDVSDFRLAAAYTTRDVVGAIRFESSRRVLMVADMARHPHVYILETVVPGDTRVVVRDKAFS